MLHEGPDQLMPSDGYTSSSIDKSVELRLTDDDSVIPVSVVTIFERTARNFPDKIAMVDSYNSLREEYSYRRYYNLVIRISKAFIKIGLEVGKGVGIIGMMSPHWTISHLAAIHAGGFAVGVKKNIDRNVCKDIVNDIECNIIVVENDFEVDKLLTFPQTLSHLKAIIQYRGRPKHANVYSWDDVKRMNVDDLDLELITRMRDIAPNKCCSVVVTSDGTSQFKYAMISHDNIVWQAKRFVSHLNDIEIPANEVIVSYRQGGDITTLLYDIYLPLLNEGGMICFANVEATEHESFFRKMRQFRPTFFYSPPPTLQLIVDSTKDVAPHKFVEFLGFERCRYVSSRSIPGDDEIRRYFFERDLTIFHLYEKTEITGPYVTAECNSKKECGHSVVIKMSDDRNRDGEICMKSRNIFIGYLKNERATINSFDDQHWFRSGDVGHLDHGEIKVVGNINYDNDN